MEIVLFDDGTGGPAMADGIARVAATNNDSTDNLTMSVLLSLR
jgi:hypothetical protein